MILHLFDDEKIVERTISYFEEYRSGENKYIVFVDPDKDAVFVSPSENIILCKKDNIHALLESMDISSVQSCIIHYLNIPKYEFAKELPASVKIYWCIWGADLYNQFLEPKGYQLYYTPPSKERSRSIKGLYQTIRLKIKYYRLECFIKKRVDFFMSDFPPDIDLLAEYFNMKINSSSCKEFFYYPVYHILGDLYNADFKNGTKVIIGNSGSFTNNHLYILEQLKKADIKIESGIIQLAYGGTSAYRQQVRNIYTQTYGEIFHFNNDLMSLSEYNRILLSGKVFLFGNWRQEAVGNIIIALYLGAKVFLSCKNPLYKWYKKTGFSVFELESITQDEIDTPLSDSLKLRNRQLIEERYSRERLVWMIKNNF